MRSRGNGGAIAGAALLLACCGVIRTCGAHGNENGQAEGAQHAIEDPRQQDSVARKNELDAKAAKADEARADHASRVASFAAMKPVQRAAQVAELCPNTRMLARRTVQQILNDDQPCDDEEGIAALLESVQGTAEGQRLGAAVDAARRRRRQMHETATKSAKCCDGTLSDTCTCNGVHSGCCSHHGGVCGCE
jgi:hypothetical protein